MRNYRRTNRNRRTARMWQEGGETLMDYEEAVAGLSLPSGSRPRIYMDYNDQILAPKSLHYLEQYLETYGEPVRYRTTSDSMDNIADWMIRPASRKANRRVAGITKQDIEIVTVRKVDMGGGWEFYATIHDQGGYAWYLFNPSGELDTIRLTNSIDRALGTAEVMVENKLRAMSITDEEKEQLMRDNQNYLKGLKGGSRRANRKRANKELALVVFDQIGGDLWEEVVDDLYDGDYESVVRHMSQWDYGEYHDFETESNLYGYTMDMGHYVLNYSTSPAPHVALYVKNETHRANRRPARSTNRRADRKVARDLIEEVLYDAQDLVEDGTLRDEYDFYDEIADQTYQVLDTTPEEIAEIYEAMKDTGLVSGNATTPDKMVEELVDVVLDNVTYVPKGAKRANRKTASAMSLDEALQQVANASFYEDLVVIPVDGGFVVEDGGSYLSEGWYYTEMGLEGPNHFETTRLMESYEHFDSPHHIRYNMPESVEALENGQAVEFAYAVVMDLDIDWGDDELNEMYDGDEVAGWLLVSQIQ